jgi:hypothetical protein
VGERWKPRGRKVTVKFDRSARSLIPLYFHPHQSRPATYISSNAKAQALRDGFLEIRQMPDPSFLSTRNAYTNLCKSWGTADGEGSETVRRALSYSVHLARSCMADCP